MLLVLVGSCARPAARRPGPDESPPVIARPRTPPRDTAVAAPVTAEPDPAARQPAPARDSTTPAAPAAPPATTAEPEVRVGLAVGASSVTVGGGAALMVTDRAGAFLTVIPAEASWRAVPGTRGVALSAAGGARAADTELTVSSRESGGFVRINSREYRGRVTLIRDRTGLTAVNHVGLDDYLMGVLGGEMGSRPQSDLEALRAQAVVSRTFALRNRGRWRRQGFDYYATVADQVYPGVGGENDLARQAVSDTRGMVVSYGGAPIDAFFFSTCGGRTELGTEVFRAADRPYLRSIPDTDPAGRAYCASSPRYRWTEEWTGEALRSTLRRFLPDAAKVPVERITRIRDVRIASRTTSGRVGRLVVSLPGGDVAVESPTVRQALRRPSGEILRSTLFSLRAATSGGEITHLTAEGGGSGHGVGLCQWGAIGRARAGQRYDRIIAAYYPGTTLERFY